MQGKGPVRWNTALPRAAAVCAWVLSFGFGVPGGYALWYFAHHGRVWMFLGFPTYDGGPFVAVGVATSVPLLSAFLVVCVTEAAVGWLLWQRRRAGTVLALTLLPVEGAFWLGFALPFGPALGLVRTALVLWARRTSRRMAVNRTHDPA